jgi:hypothetical protein
MRKAQICAMAKSPLHLRRSFASRRVLFVAQRSSDRGACDVAFGSGGGDAECAHRGRRRRPQPARIATRQPRRLIRVHRLRDGDGVVQLAPGVMQHAADAPDHGVDRAGADLDPVRVKQKLCDLLAREPAHPGQQRHMRMQARPERAQPHSRGQLRQHRLAAARTRKPQPPPLAHVRDNQRQLPLLMRDRLPNPLLATNEPIPAPAPLRQTLKRSGRQLLRLGRLATRSRMTGLSALLALRLKALLRPLTRQLPTLLTGHGGSFDGAFELFRES